MRRRALVIWLRIGFLVVLTGGLELLCRTGVIPRLTMVPPSEMATQLWRGLASGEYGGDIAFTFANIGFAVAISVVLGAALGVGIHAAPRLRRVLDPLLASYYSVPTFVFYPLLIVMLGLTRWPLVAIGAMFGIVAMILNTINGLDRIPRVMIKAGRVFRLSPWATVWRIKLPAAAPSLFTGVKLAVTYSVIGVIAGEFILSVAGLGRQIKFAYDNLDNPAMYALLLFVLSATVIVYFVVHGWERRVHRRWGA